MNGRHTIVYEDVCPQLTSEPRSVCQWWQPVPTCSVREGVNSAPILCSQPWRELNEERRNIVWGFYPNQQVYQGGRPFWRHNGGYGLHNI